MENITKHPVASFDQLPREVAEAHDKLDLILGLVQGFIDSQKPSGPKMLTAEEAAVFLKKKRQTSGNASIAEKMRKTKAAWASDYI